MKKRKTSLPLAVAGSIATTANPNRLSNGSCRHGGIEDGKRTPPPCPWRPPVSHELLPRLMLLLLTLSGAAQAQFNYVVTNGTITITGYTDPGGAVNIPDTVSGYPVTVIWDNAFFNCGTLTSVTIPGSVISIGGRAFDNCSSLSRLTIGNSVTSIGDCAFSGCSSLASVTIPNSVTVIGYSAFSGCSSLFAITVDALNNAYSAVDGVLFDKSRSTLIQCSGGKAGSYTIPDRVTSIGGAAFGGCTSLTSIPGSSKK